MAKKIKLSEQTIIELQDYLFEIYISSCAAISHSISTIDQVEAICKILQNATGEDFELFDREEFEDEITSMMIEEIPDEDE